MENVGEYEGDEVVQLYLHDTVSSIVRPIKELKRFKRVTLESGEKTTVNFTLTPEDFACYDVNMKLVVEPGIFKVMIGSSWENIYLRGNFDVKKTE